MSKSYETKSVAEPRNHQVYLKFIKALGLKPSHRTDLIKRKLTEEHIAAAQYATKQSNTVQDTVMALGCVVNNFDLDDVPGFYIDDKSGNWTQSKMVGLVIPVRDYNGKISSLLIRNDNAKIGEQGKIEKKYIAFSSKDKNKGSKVWQTTHCPILTGPAKKVSGTSVRITEGVLKADVATALGEGIYCLGMQGLKYQADLPGVLAAFEISEIIISLDAGEDENTDMLQAKAKLILLAKELGIDFKVETWDRKYGKGIDDVLAAGQKDKIKIAAPREIEEILESAAATNPNNGEWILNNCTERFINIINFQSLSKSQFANKFRLETTYAVNKLIAAGFEQVDSLTFLPGGDQIIFEDGRRKLNEWREPKLLPLEGDIAPFSNHINYILGDAYQCNIFLDWFAHNIQFPGIKIRWALVVIGDPGIGKSYFGSLLKNLVGEYNTSIPTNEQLHEPYTGWQRKCQIVIIEELMARGRLDLINKLKPIITQDVTKIREMHVESYDYPNRFNILAFTNFEDALLLDEKDRRYGVVKSDARMKEPAYYDALFKWTFEPQNLQAILHYFATRDIRHFNPNAKAPETQAKLEMIGMSLSPLEEWISAGLTEKFWPFHGEIIAIRHLKKRDICPSGLERISDMKWAQALKKYGALQYERQIKLSDRSAVKPWLIGDKKALLINASPTELARLYDRELQKGIPASEPLAAESVPHNVLDFKHESNPIKEDEPF